MASDTVEPITIPSNMVRGRMRWTLSTESIDLAVPALAEQNRTL
jgi:hypothetical protein